MDQASVTIPPRLRSLAQMRNRTSIFDGASSSFRSDDEYRPEISTERRAKVKMALNREPDQESLMSTQSNFSTRARAMKRPNRSPTMGPADGGSIISNWSKPSLVKPLFEFDASSMLSEKSTKSLFKNDTPWRAAKRGDLTALKQFQTSGKVNWMDKDEFDNIPLYYACQSGAIADVMVVPFLLWVTPVQDQQILEKCRKNAINKQVRSILSAYMKGGISGIVAENGNAPSVESRKIKSRERPCVKSPFQSFQAPEKAVTGDSTVPQKEEKAMVKSRDDVPDVRQLSIEPHETPSGIEITDASTISSDKSVDDDKVSTMSSDKHDDNASRRSSISETDTGVPRRVKSGSLKSMLFGDRGKMKDEEAKRSTSWMQSKQEEKVDSKPEVQYPKNQKSDSRVDERFIAPSRVDDDSSFVKAFIQTRKPPPAGNQVANERRKDLPPRPPPLKPTSKSSSWNSDEKAASEGRDETDVGDRDDWDAPIEQNRRYGHQEVQESTPSISGRDEDSWSIASMLSLKKWRNNKKQLDPEKIDNIMFTRTKNKCDGVTSPSLGQPSFDSISHGASNRDKLTRKGGNRGVFPKGPSFDSISHEASNRDMPTGKGGNRGVFPKPYIEYHENEKTWVIGNQWKQNGNGEKDKMLHVYDNKQRVHVTNCHGVNIHIHGRKMKAILVENSSDVNVIFDTVITTCEVVSCSNVGVQVTGLCPTFSIDTTKGVTVWLTREAMRSSNFVTSKSSDISISVPQSDDMHPWERKEVPLPIQYVHKFEEGGIMSHLPGKY